MADGQVVFEITGDDRGINTSIKKVTENIKQESRKWDDAAGDAADGASGSWGAAAAKIVGALSAAGVVSILSKWGKAAIDAASDLSEVQNVVDVTFGDSSGRIDAWAKQAGKAYGLTEKQAKQYTATIGAMLKSQGMADDEIVKTSTDLAGLAADMASFYNLDFDTAFQKIRSGISGETEPLKQLGINMSAANLEAFRLAQGIEKSYAAMSQSEQTALRYQYIMQATADAQGDFARTADGYANASRRVQTAMETIKTEGGKLLLEVVEPLTVGLASMLEKLTETPDTTVLDDIAAIDAKTGAKVSRIQQTAEDARLLTEELDSLSEKESLTADEQAYWLETTKRLIQTIPGLSSIINAQTGEITGGTQAVKDYLKAWEDGQTKLAMMGAVQQKEDAIAQRFGDLPGLQLDAAVAARRVREQKKIIDSIFGDAGAVWENGVLQEKRSAGVLVDLYGDDSKTYYAKAAQFQDAIKKYKEYVSEAKIAEDVYQKQKSAMEEAKAALEEYKEVVAEMPGDTEAAAAAADKLTEAQKAAAEASVEAVKTAISALADYVQSVHDATEQTVNSVVKGFDAIERPTTEMEEKRSKLIEQQNALNRSTAEGERQYQALQKQIDSLNESMSGYTAKGMEDALKSQLAFMDEYVKNLEQAQRMGLSNDLLASLSDGSVQSAEYLSQLVANPEQAKEIDALYQQVQQKKKGFTDALTDQKLAADDMYASLVDTAKGAIAQMDQGEDAKTAMENTVAGLASGISEKVPEVRSAVNDLLAELNRLSGFGVNITIPGFGSLLGPESSISFQGASAAPTGTNYDLLGDVVRANTGGNVYLDGRKVGSLISEQQGSSFRSMQRSGFQPVN